MISALRLVLLATSLLTLPVANVMAQQNNSPGTGGSALKTTTPGEPNNPQTAATPSTAAGGSALRTETTGTGKKVVPPTNPASTGVTGKQSQ